MAECDVVEVIAKALAGRLSPALADYTEGQSWESIGAEDKATWARFGEKGANNLQEEYLDLARHVLNALKEVAAL